LESQGVDVWFEELNIVDGSVTDFIYSLVQFIAPMAGANSDQTN